MTVWITKVGIASITLIQTAELKLLVVHVQVLSHADKQMWEHVLLFFVCNNVLAQVTLALPMQQRMNGDM